MILADIAEGNSGTADVFFLIAVILAVISAVAAYSVQAAKAALPLLALALGTASLAWLVL